jgi:hypothetical protein
MRYASVGITPEEFRNLVMMGGFVVLLIRFSP